MPFATLSADEWVEVVDAIVLSPLRTLLAEHDTSLRRGVRLPIATAFAVSLCVVDLPLVSLYPRLSDTVDTML